MKKWIQSAVLYISYFFLPVFAADNQPLYLSQNSINNIDVSFALSLDRKAVFRPPHKPTPNTPSRTLLFNADQMNPNTSTGADKIVFSDNIPFTVISLPNESLFTVPPTEGPALCLAFQIPNDYKKQSLTELTFTFLTHFSSDEISGDVQFIVQAYILHPNGKNELVTLDEPLIHRVKNASLPTLGIVPANRYLVRTGKLNGIQNGGFVVLTISRNNSISDNFKADVYVSSLEFIYNIPPPAILMKSAPSIPD